MEILIKNSFALKNYVKKNILHLTLHLSINFEFIFKYLTKKKWFLLIMLFKILLNEQ